jgi:hypothetical protein
VINGKVLTVRHIYRDLWGGAGIEHAEMAQVLDLYELDPGYRSVSLENWKYGGFPKQLAETMKTVPCSRWGWLPDTCYAEEKDKVWFFSRQFRQAVVLTWDDTYANGRRVGNGYYKRDGMKIVRFDEVVPYYGGTMFVHESGLIEIQMPPRHTVASDLQGCVMNQLLDSEGNCDVKSAFLPSAYGTYGEDKVFAILGWQADRGGTNAAADTIRRHMNLNALKIDGRTPTMKDRAKEMLDSGAFWIPFTVMVLEGNYLLAAAVEYYFPEWATGSTTLARPRAVENADELLEREPAFVNGVQMAESEVRSLALQKYGLDEVVGEFEAASARGWYWKIRSMSPAAARAQAMQDGEILEIVPGKYIAKEFFTGGTNGVWADGYDEVASLLRENKGYHGFMVKNGAIDPSFVTTKDKGVLKIVDQIERYVRATQSAGDRVQVAFDEPTFPAALEEWLATNRPDLYRLMGTGDGKVFWFVVY